MLEKLSRMSLKKQQYTTEILKGTMNLHGFFASKIEDSEANVFDSSSLLYTHGNPMNLRKSLANKANFASFENHNTFSVNVTLIERHLENSSMKLIRHYQDHGKEVISLSFRSNDYSHFLVHQLSHFNKGVILHEV